MIALSAEQLADVVGGELVDPTTGANAVDDVVIDSRQARPGSLFVPLVGERTDGHRYITAALRAGASATLVAADRAAALLAELDGLDGDAAAQRLRSAAAVIVDDPADALLGLGAWVRETVDPLVIAVTGSSGKTTTKDLAAAALSAQRVTVANPGSYNNELGVPLTCCRLELSSEVLVAEIGARGPGHIAGLAPVLAPDVAIVTTVSSAHVGLFGSVEQTARAKAELVESLAAGGTAILNADDPRVAAMAQRAPAGVQVVTYGHAAAADWRPQQVGFDAHARAHFSVQDPAGTGRVEVRVPVPGEHNVGNALAALAAAHIAGVDLAAAAAGLATAAVSPWRMELGRAATGATVLNDAYNANPASTAAALRTLARLAVAGRRWAVLGHMAELGAHSERAHAGVGRLAAELGVDRLLVVGEEAAGMLAGARAAGAARDSVQAVPDVDAAIAVLRAELDPADAVLVKASRSAGLDRVAAALLAPSGQPADGCGHAAPAVPEQGGPGGGGA